MTSKDGEKSWHDFKIQFMVQYKLATSGVVNLKHILLGWSFLNKSKLRIATTGTEPGNNLPSSPTHSLYKPWESDSVHTQSHLLSSYKTTAILFIFYVNCEQEFVMETQY